MAFTLFTVNLQVISIRAFFFLLVDLTLTQFLLLTKQTKDYRDSSLRIVKLFLNFQEL